MRDQGTKGKGEEPRLARWEVIDRVEHADCRVFTVERKVARHPKREGSADFFSLKSPDWVNVFAERADGRIVLVRQFRFGVEEFSIEVPGGIIDEGEDPVEAGVRELAEETGYVGKRARLIGSVAPNPAIIDNRCWYVVVEEAEKVRETDWDSNEEIEVVLMSIEEMRSAIATGELDHLLTIGGFYLYLRKQGGS